MRCHSSRDHESPHVSRRHDLFRLAARRVGRRCGSAHWPSCRGPAPSTAPSRRAGVGSPPTVSTAGRWGSVLPAKARSGCLPPLQERAQLVDFFLQRAIAPGKHQNVQEEQHPDSRVGRKQEIQIGHDLTASGRRTAVTRVPNKLPRPLLGKEGSLLRRLPSHPYPLLCNSSLQIGCEHLLAQVLDRIPQASAFGTHPQEPHEQ
jgi:hypothetical protein